MAYAVAARLQNFYNKLFRRMHFQTATTTTAANEHKKNSPHNVLYGVMVKCGVVVNGRE